MSFKIKKWGYHKLVDVRDLLPTASGYPYTDGAVPMAYSWAGRILFLFYDSASSHQMCWAVYDPATDEWGDLQRITNPSAYNNVWVLHSYTFGDDRLYGTFGSHYLYATGLTQNYYTGTPYLYGWDADFNLTWASLGSPGFAVADGRAFDNRPGLGSDGMPARLWYVWSAWNNPPQKRAIITQSLGGAAETLAVVTYGTPPELYVPTAGGSTYILGAPCGGPVSISVLSGDCGSPVGNAYNIYADYPTTENKCSASAGQAQVMGCQSYGGGSWLYMQLPNGTNYNAEPGAPLAEATLPFNTTWQWRRMRDGLSYALDEGDLDGSAHSVVLPSLGEPSYNPGDGYYTAIGGQAGLTANVYRLDPHQPAGRAVLPHTAGSAAIGWLGDYAIRPNLKVESLLPFPDKRASSGQSMPPQECADGFVLAEKEVYRRTGGALHHHKDAVIALDASFQTGSPDWWFPGDWLDASHHHGFWDIFAGDSDTIIGRMPDYMFGMLNPVGRDVMYGLGKPGAWLAGDGPAFTLSSNQTLPGTSFAGPLIGSGQRRMLLSSPDGPARFYYYESTILLTQPPFWNALAGYIRKGIFETCFNLRAVTPPDLGQTSWTVWSLTPIPPCRALPRGGYLVGATLYFAPWAKGAWELDPGTRDATFRDSGQGWVPAKPGADGPKTCLDRHAPVYLVAEDEWGANRSLYGPDALLVFDEHGAFVECLNSFDLYPPDGREILVTRENPPRVIFRIYRHGTYSDYAEAWGQYHALGSNEEIQAPLYACYNLLDAQGRIGPGAGEFRGFLDMHAVGRKGASWRWDTCAPTLYDWRYPKTVWAPPGPARVRSGRVGVGLTPLTPGPASSRAGVRGMGQRSGAQQ